MRISDWSSDVCSSDLPAVIRALSEAGLFDGDAASVNGRSVAANCADAPNWNPDVIRPIETPFMAEAGIVVLRGNLAPDGAIIKIGRASGRESVCQSV